ncbi:MAG: type II/IV secretion system protein [Candidatus Omnitrophica bacterium]|nr:type II/IV secretion system protein [Candidatus Omnitrophota bacterium]
MAISREQLIQAAVQRGLVKAQRVKELEGISRRSEDDLLDQIINHERIPIAAFYQAFAETRQLPYINLATVVPSETLCSRVPSAFLSQYMILPIGEHAGKILVAMADPDEAQAISSLEQTLGQKIAIGIAEPMAISTILTRLSFAEGEVPRTSVTVEPESDSVEQLNQILKEAHLRRASDIHLEPQEEGLRVRLRVDGGLQEIMSGLNSSQALSLISRIKVLAEMDIAEQRIPQDGGFTVKPPIPKAERMDMRVATAPSRWGERVTLRVRNKADKNLTLDTLGMSSATLARFHSAIHRPFGMALMTGPTGSGKTTTLYAAINEINRPNLNILTAEDPVESIIPGATQVPVGTSGKVDFAGALRALLRHDPDVLMVGEIRDLETADVAFKAALSGHMVFSSLHSNTASVAIARLTDIGCEPYLIGATLAVVMAHRLVRRLCVECKVARTAGREESILLGNEGAPVQVYSPKGCSHCLGTGFKGRVGMYEALWVDEAVAATITKGGSPHEIEEAAGSNLTPLREDARAKVLEGVTSLEEVMTVAIL